MTGRKTRRWLEDTGLSDLLWRAGLFRPLLDLREALGQPSIRRAIQQDWTESSAVLAGLAAAASNQPLRAGTVLIASTVQLIAAKKLEALWALVLRFLGYRPIAVETLLRHGRWTRAYLGAAGVDQVHDLHRIIASQPWPQPTSEIRAFEEAATPRLPELLDISYRGVDIGRIALSNLLYRYKFRTFNIQERDTHADMFRELCRVQRNVHGAEDLLEQTKPVLAFAIEKGLSPGAELFGAAAARGIPFIQQTSSQNPSDFILRRYDFENRHQHPFSLSPETWSHAKTMPWSGAHEQTLMDDFADGYLSGKWFNRKFLHEERKIKSREEVFKQLGLDPSKKTAVVFSHVLWDATFFYGRGLFEDYETWLTETVRAAYDNPALNWVIKLHPDLTWKLKFEGFSGELRDRAVIEAAAGGRLPEHVRLVMPSTDISTYSFFGLTDYCLTVRGTIGIEMACHGVPVLTAGTGRYSGLGFTVDSATSEELLHRVRHIQDLPPMTPAQLELARRFAYALFKLRPWPLRSFEVLPAERGRVTHPLEPKVLAHVTSPDSFFAAPDIQELMGWVESGQADYIRSG